MFPCIAFLTLCFRITQNGWMDVALAGCCSVLQSNAFVGPCRSISGPRQLLELCRVWWKRPHRPFPKLVPDKKQQYSDTSHYRNLGWSIKYIFFIEHETRLSPICNWPTPRGFSPGDGFQIDFKWYSSCMLRSVISYAVLAPSLSPSNSCCLDAASEHDKQWRGKLQIMAQMLHE